MEPNQRLFISGTMRTGGSLLTNMLSAHSSILVLFERVHFFRFIYKKYDPLNEKKLALLLLHLSIRLRYRFNLEVDVDKLFNVIVNKEISYTTIYDELLKYFMERSGKNT